MEKSENKHSLLSKEKQKEEFVKCEAIFNESFRATTKATSLESYTHNEASSVKQLLKM